MYSNCSYATEVSLPVDKANKKQTKTYQLFRTGTLKTRSGQGCKLSPLLANIFLSDLHEELQNDLAHAPYLKKYSITSISGADDLLMVSLNEVELQKCLQNLQKYAKNGV